MIKALERCAQEWWLMRQSDPEALGPKTLRMAFEQASLKLRPDMSHAASKVGSQPLQGLDLRVLV